VVGRYRAEYRYGYGYPQERPGKSEVNQSSAVITDKTRREPKGFCKQRNADRRHGRRQRVLRAEQWKHKPIEREVHLVFVNLAALHYEIDVEQFIDILQGRRVNGDDVGELAGFDRAGGVTPVDEIRCVYGRRNNDIHF